jgi:hypothetical protein
VSGELDAVIGRLGDGPGVAVTVLYGPPDVTAEAARSWAVRNCGRFPRGHLHIDFAAYRRPRGVDLHAVARRLLRRLGVMPWRIPRAFPSRVDMFRVWSRSRRLLVVINNADQAAQVRPFVPTSPGSVVIVTSNRELRGLVIGYSTEFVCMWPQGEAPSDTPAPQ